MKSPQEIAAAYLGIAEKKAAMPAHRLFILGIFAGAFIAFAAAGAGTASCLIENAGVAKLVGALIFPAGLAMVMLAGGELFTGNCLMISAVLQRKISLFAMLRNWALVYAGNFAGALLIAWLVSAGHQLSLFDGALAQSAVLTATAKLKLGFWDAFIRGILCNMLVCVAVWMGLAAKEAGGVILGLYLPVMLFVLCGFEHSVANMYYVPVGLLALQGGAGAAGEAVSLGWPAFLLRNLLPVTLGNIAGGMLVGAGYWRCYLGVRTAVAQQDAVTAPGQSVLRGD